MDGEISNITFDQILRNRRGGWGFFLFLWTLLAFYFLLRIISLFFPISFFPISALIQKKSWQSFRGKNHFRKKVFSVKSLNDSKCMFYSLELQRSVESLNFTKITKEVGLRYNISCFLIVLVTYLLTKVFELAIHPFEFQVITSRAC